MSEAMVLKNARFVLTMDEGKVLENVSIRVSEGRIDYLGEKVKQRGDEVLDCSGSIVMPGLVNSHTHSSMVALRGLNDDARLSDWLDSMWGIEERLTGELARKASELAFLEMVRTGTTSCLDMYEAFDAAGAAERVGLRMANGPALLSRFAPAKERLAQTREFAERYRDSDRIIPVVNLHSIYTNEDEAISKAAELSRKLRAPLHVHCSETREEVFASRKGSGKLAVERLYALGALWERAVLAHLGWAASWEFKRIQEKGCGIVHCPSSNLKLGTGGFFPFRDLKAMGVRIGLGTDSAASNNSLDMFREMKEMALVQKGQYWDATACLASDALEAGTLGGNRILGLKGGAVMAGLNADLTVVRIGPGILPLRGENLASALAYSATGDMVQGTMVQGEWVYLDGKDREGEKVSERSISLSEEINEALFSPRPSS
jgi:cytosine/adenosine deaminase-related metal-dependent hydrolase